MRILQGVDIQSIARFQQSAERQGEAFLARVFTPQEREYCEAKRMKYEHYAARFAAKEAVMKALNVSRENPVSFQDVEVLNEASGRPFLKLSTALEKQKDLASGFQCDLSLSHEREYAVATVLFNLPD